MNIKYKITPEQHDNTLLLSDLINIDESEQLELFVTIPDNIRIKIIDDLASGHAEKSFHQLTFTIKENSSLDYEMRLVEKGQDQGTALEQSLTKNLNLHLAGTGAHASAHTIWFGQSNKQLIVNTMQHHQVPHTNSNCVIKTVLSDSASIQCTSMIKVDKNAQHTQAEQSNKNIMLSPQARALSVPQLEIEADDVSCKHGAAMSRFDDEQRFYLQSRGLDEQTSQELLIDAFLTI